MVAKFSWFSQGAIRATLSIENRTGVHAEIIHPKNPWTKRCLVINKDALFKILHIISSYKKARPDGQILISDYGENEDNYVNASKNSQKFAENVLLYLKKYNINKLDLN